MQELDKTSVPYNITLIVTEDCNLRCSYCFEHHKSKKKMNLPTARRTLDDLLSHDTGFQWVNIEFSGGEPMLNFELIQQVFYYVKTTFPSDSRKFTFNIGTNGTVLTEEMKAWLERFPCITIGLSLDGTKEVHDRNRCNSYDRVMDNLNFFKLYNVPVKMTIGPTTIPHLTECITHIHQLGFAVEANVVFEDVWGNPKNKAALLHTYAEELAKLVNYYDAHRELKPPFLIDGGIEALLQSWDDDHRFCGSGTNMVAVDPEGRYFPCHRFAPVASGRPGEGAALMFDGVRPGSCAHCSLRRMCHSCLAYNYEVHGTINHRTTHHCEFVKLQMRAAAQLRYRTILKVLGGELRLPPSELKTLSDAIVFIEEHVEPVEEICNRLLGVTN
jgi:radical SAM protein with 4Fe4S-binding SPASM domain